MTTADNVATTVAGLSALIANVKASRPNDRSELDRLYAMLISDLQKARGFFAFETSGHAAGSLGAARAAWEADAVEVHFFVASETACCAAIKQINERGRHVYDVIAYLSIGGEWEGEVYSRHDLSLSAALRQSASFIDAH